MDLSIPSGFAEGINAVPCKIKMWGFAFAKPFLYLFTKKEQVFTCSFFIL